MRAQGDLARRHLAPDNAVAATKDRLPDPPPALSSAQLSGKSDAPSVPPAGWYPDGSGSGQRYWDGHDGPAHATLNQHLSRLAYC